MGSRAIAVMGESGSGKTTAMRTLKPEETYYIDCDGKGLNWRGWRQQYNAERKNYCRSNNQNSILRLMVNLSDMRTDIKNIVIDTANSIMVADEFRRMKEKGYDKWQDLAYSVYLIITTASGMRDDMNIIILFHSQTDIDETTGERFTHIKTSGKKLEKIIPESFFTTVLLARRNDSGNYIFETHANHSTVKTPIDSFESDEIDNDMQSVLDVLAEF